jgi:hypothetical protein
MGLPYSRPRRAQSPRCITVGEPRGGRANAARIRGMLRSIMRGTFGSFSGLAAALGAVFVVAQGAPACTPEERQFETTGGAGAGGGKVCEPGTSRPCYSGPPETLDTGTCKAGVEECLSDGTAYGECAGEVLPQAEDCTTQEDEACNGVDAVECPSLGHVWSKTFGDSSQQQLTGLAVDPSNGDIVFVGSLRGTIDFGGGPMASTGPAADGFVVKLDALGNHKWSKRFGDASSQLANAVAIGPGGVIYVGGQMSGSADFGDGVIKTSAGGDDAFLAKFDPDGNVVWSKLYGDASSQSIVRLATTAAGQVVAAGVFSGSIDFGKGAVMSAGLQDSFVIKVDDAGFFASSRFIAGPGFDSIEGVAVDAAGNVVITGEFEQTVTSLGASLTSAGQSDVYVGKLSPVLAPTWAKGFGDAADQDAYDIALAPNGDLVVAGGSGGTIDFGGGPLTPQAPAEGMYLARIDGTGAHVWSKIYGGAMSTGFLARLAFDPKTAELVVAGWFDDTIDFGGNPLVSKGFFDAFITRLSPEGAHVVSASYGSPMPDGVFGMGLLPTRDPIIGGIHFDTFDLGGGPLPTASNMDANVFVARLLH